MSDIIEEVGFDHAEERKLKYFKHALPWVIGATILIIIGMAIYNYRAEKRVAHNREMGDMLIKAMSVMGSDEKAANEALSYLVKEGSEGMRDIAMLEKVAMAFRGGKREVALQELEKISLEAHNKLTQSYAKIVWMSVVVDQQKMSEQEKELMLSSLKSFKDDSVEFYGTAQVLGSLFYAKNDQIEEAKSALQKVIASDNVPPLVKDQAQALLANLSA